MFRPRGNSMMPRIQSGQLCTVVPPAFAPNGLVPGEVALCKVHGHEYLHFIKQIKGEAPFQRYLIGNARGKLNGWANASHIYGILVNVEP